MLVDYLIQPIPGGRDNRNAGIFVKHGHIANDVVLDIGKSLGDKENKKDGGQDITSTTIIPPIAAQVGDATKNSKPKSHERNTETSQVSKSEITEAIASRKSGISPTDDSSKVDNQNSNSRPGPATLTGPNGEAPDKNSNPQGKKVVFNFKSAAQKLSHLRKKHHYSDDEEKLVKAATGTGDEISQKAIASQLGKTESWVTRHLLRLRTIPDHVVIWKNPGHDEGHSANIEYYKFGKSKPGPDSDVLTPEQEFEVVKDEVGLDSESLAKSEEQVVPALQVTPAEQSPLALEANFKHEDHNRKVYLAIKSESLADYQALRAPWKSIYPDATQERMSKKGKKGAMETKWVPLDKIKHVITFIQQRSRNPDPKIQSTTKGFSFTVWSKGDNEDECVKDAEAIAEDVRGLLQTTFTVRTDPAKVSEIADHVSIKDKKSNEGTIRGQKAYVDKKSPETTHPPGSVEITGGRDAGTTIDAMNKALDKDIPNLQKDVGDLKTNTPTAINELKKEVGDLGHKVDDLVDTNRQMIAILKKSLPQENSQQVESSPVPEGQYT